MEVILKGYDVNGPTWFYLSLLLIIAVFFKFDRIWSLRNLDLALLLALAPGLLLVRSSEATSAFGYAWLFVVTGAILVRLLSDSLFTRRPRLEQNLNASGMAFLCVSALAFQMTKVMTLEPHAAVIETARRADDLLKRQDGTSASGLAKPLAPLNTTVAQDTVAQNTLAQNTGATDKSPTDKSPADETTVAALPDVRPGENPRSSDARNVETNDPGKPIESGPAGMLLATPIVQMTGGVTIWTTRTLAILAHLATCLGLIAVGRWHFSDTRIGLAMATLYLLLPITAFDVNKVTHLLPAALIVWAFACYKTPSIAGVLLGLACGSLFFAIFLLPVWLAFYWKRGAARFSIALGGVVCVMLLCLIMTAADSHSLTRQIVGSIDWAVLKFDSGTGKGFWGQYDQSYRIPVFAVFMIMLTVITIWPLRKNLEHLMAHSAAIIVATQFWYPHEGGVYILWYMPVMLIVMFRPRLAHLPPRSLDEPSTLSTSGVSSRTRAGNSSSTALRTQFYR
ncbi:MAG: hypothetical protein C0478_12710 [Planctomyces sp.]|nr:hypothetical protein [Planctomyces sp.]